MLRLLGKRPSALATFLLLALGSPTSASSPIAQDGSYEPAVEPASSEALENLATIETQPGIELDLWAAEPMVANPVCLYVSNAGTAYVAETFRHHAGVTDIREHMDWLDDDLAAGSVAERAAYFEKHEGPDYAKYTEEHERIRLIRDTDGDGQADQAIVFADGFNDPMAGIGAGLLEHEGSLYYTCIPDLWRLTDADGDGRAEQREKLATGFGVNVALLGHDLHGLRIGPDGRLYFSSGDRGFRVETENGVIDHAHTGAVLRCNLDGTGLEVFATGLRNPQELVFDEFGNLWTGDNNSDGGDKARWVYVVEGMDAGWRYGWQWITEPNLRGPWNDEKLWHPQHPGQAAYILPPVANLGDGPSGLSYYPGTGLPDTYAGHFFLCDFRGTPSSSGIHTFTVEPKGAGFELGPVDWFVKNTLVTDADFGPDGRLWFTDWVFGWNKTGKGRIYRAFDPRTISSELVETTAKLLAEGVGDYEPEALIEQLAHPDQRVRQLVQFELVDRALLAPEVAELLEALSLDVERPRLARLHAIWGLDMLHRQQRLLGETPDQGPAWMHDPARDPTRLLADPDIEVRAQMVRALDDSNTASEALIARLSDESPRVQSLAAIALGKRGEVEAFGPLVELLAESASGQDLDPVLRHAAIMGLVGTAKIYQLGELRTHPSSNVRLGAVVALRRLHERGEYAAEKLAEYLADDEALVVLEAARAIYDLGVERCYPNLALLGERDGERETELSYPLLRRVLNAHLRVGERWNALALCDFVLREDLDERLRVEALHLLSIWNAPPGRDYVTGEWRPIEPREADFLPMLVTELGAAHGDGTGIEGAPRAVQKAWIETVMQVAPEQNALRLANWALERERPASIRAACLRALRDTGDPQVLSRLREAYSDPAAEVRAAALVALRRVAPAEILPLVETALQRGSLPERRAAYQALAELDVDGTLALLEPDLARLNSELIATELALDLVLAAESQKDETLDALLQERLDARASDPTLAPWLDSLFGGDRERGEQLFRENATLSCLRCHRIEPDSEGLGEPRVGPDLIGVNERLSRLDLVTAMVDPNRQIASGFATESFHFLEGGALSGRVLSESEAEINVLDSEGEVHGFAPTELELRRASLSAMPTNLADSLSRSDMRDLVEFLSSL